jgi:hypothetical protein
MRGTCYFAPFSDPPGSRCEGPLRKTHGSNVYCEGHYGAAMERANWERQDNDARKLGAVSRINRPGDKTHKDWTKSGGDR